MKAEDREEKKCHPFSATFAQKFFIKVTLMVLSFSFVFFSRKF